MNTTRATNVLLSSIAVILALMLLHDVFLPPAHAQASPHITRIEACYQQFPPSCKWVAIQVDAKGRLLIATP
jgi:hypothetical protein